MSSQQRLVDVVREQRCNLLALRSLVDPRLVKNDRLTWLFILTLPNSGSTALAETLLTADAAASLNRPSEGQWLVPSLSNHDRRWDPGLRVSYRKVRAVWLAELRSKSPDKTVIVEKSPPNLCRFEDLLASFADSRRFVMTFSRDPYATCASWHLRYGPSTIAGGGGTDTTDRAREHAYFRGLGHVWIGRARMLLDARSHADLHTSYEAFTERPRDILDELSSLIPEFAAAEPTASIVVKDYAPQPLRNMNADQIARLTGAQIAAISEALETDPSTVERLGYSVR